MDISSEVDGASKVSSRRDALAALGCVLFTMTGAHPTLASRRSGQRRSMAIDLREVPIIDVNVQQLKRQGLSEAYAGQSNSLLGSTLQSSALAMSPAARARLALGFREQMVGAPRLTGYLNYVARAYGIPATIEAADLALRDAIADEAGFSSYVTATMDRENIQSLIVHSSEAAPVRPRVVLAPKRFAWSYAIDHLANPQLAVSHGLKAALDMIDDSLQKASREGCVAYNCYAAIARPLVFASVSPEQAARALQQLVSATSSVPDNPANSEAPARICADYLYHHIMLRAGELQRPIVLHSAAVLAPMLTINNNDPRPLQSLFADPALLAIGTKFVIASGGYPFMDVAAALASQFPSVHVDVSFLSKYPLLLENAYRTLLAVCPVGKILYGSDSGAVAGEIGYCAWNARHALARVLEEYREFYGWSVSDAFAIANRVLHINAQTLFRLSNGI